MASTLVRVSGLTRCGAEKVRDTVEMCTPDAFATSRMVTATMSSSADVIRLSLVEPLMQTVAGVSTPFDVDCVATGGPK
ncbi:hypothetical protein GCM10010168_81310 [Actinoplanes ianthinogenes]|uniref:Uncharacterized protein n=1 Tax=Actinoplanes ianthinogenes TaxID=122358 RepID=A0ABM7LMM7_9ACTN|nr:hypothetical protein Aiant_11920 [Actinoplanes ianthinogenes]GGR50284.1 hypothetical protein GCM10010168_81310 [Actinoplanes ianthinogenes]